MRVQSKAEAIAIKQARSDLRRAVAAAGVHPNPAKERARRAGSQRGKLMSAALLDEANRLWRAL